MGSDLDIIKKKYGEKMAHLCRELFPTLLERDGLLSELLLSKFNPDRSLYDSLVEHNKIEDFKNYIYSFVDVETKNKIIVNKTPKELMSDAGYILYECKTEEEIQAFKRYYKSDEELCTFNGDRLETNYVFFAVKKDVDGIKREDFLEPERQDKYGTSVISIQFTYGDTNTLSIKNRYNHTVNSPDATFSNNLDNIIYGLTDSFTREYNLNVVGNKTSFELPGYVLAQDGKLYKYNYEIDNIYYCPDNIIINERREVEKLDKSRYLLIDYFVIDLKKDNRTISLGDSYTNDCFPDYFKEKGIKNIEIINIDDGKEIKVTLNNDEEVIIRVDKFNRITYLKNDNIIEIGNDFLQYNESLTSIELPQVQRIRDRFLLNNNSLSAIKLPQVQIIGNDFLAMNHIITAIELPQVHTIGNDFLFLNETLISIKLSQLQSIGSCFIDNNNVLTSIELPQVREIGNFFLNNNRNLISIELPQVQEISSYFLSNNQVLTSIKLPSVQSIGLYFLYSNISLTTLELPEVQTIGRYFLNSNKKLIKIELPKLTDVAEYNSELIKNYLNNIDKNQGTSK